METDATQRIPRQPPPPVGPAIQRRTSPLLVAVLVALLVAGSIVVGVYLRPGSSFHVLAPCGNANARSVHETKHKRVVIVCANRQVKIVE